MDRPASELLDEREIRNVVLRYCRGIDRMDRELVRSCYHDDAVDVHGPFRGSVDDFLDWAWRQMSRHDRTFHFLGNMLIELRGDRAHVETYAIAHHFGEADDPARNLTLGFRYIDRFERRDVAGWRIAQRVLVSDWCETRDPALRWPIPDAYLLGTRGADDPLHESREWLEG
jgi:hypothetical protein